MKSLAEISIIMPIVDSSKRTGNSKPPNLCVLQEIERQQQRDQRSDQRQRLHEARESVADEGAVEGDALDLLVEHDDDASATPSSATAISVTSQTDLSPRSAPTRISASTPSDRMNSGITTGSENAVTSISYRLKVSPRSKPGRRRRRRVLDALQQLLDRRRAGVEDRLRMHAVVDASTAAAGPGRTARGRSDRSCVSNCGFSSSPNWTRR